MIKNMYPVIEKYLKDNNLTVRQFSELVDASYPVVQKMLAMKTSPQKWLIDNVLKEIGEPYEIVFREGPGEPHSPNCKYH